MALVGRAQTEEPGANSLLPDGGQFQAGELGTDRWVQVIHGIYGGGIGRRGIAPSVVPAEGAAL
ncbi:MAG TPA: hypothetical protein PKG50_05170 [Candidatus Bipolaricaulis anaerobius]|nr:hypothetical protein [Candidatus Bipolaricaulis anaerobius]HNR24793.1 hypothetical protein [Candidatus Bipolaricaulis anaerobius]HNS24146.1 hypothetical protein [Candidatus Bipolaricaulis anaerobius]HOD73369.1 hypothetical protein [Candidatus Bipolaricaulis anaerobius]HQM37948.1 hypothetical protein [Candidatus Bipolaricaulis anaerobius]